MINTFIYHHITFIVVEDVMKHTNQKFFKHFWRNVITLSWLSKTNTQIYEKLKELFYE